MGVVVTNEMRAVELTGIILQVKESSIILLTEDANIELEFDKIQRIHLDAQVNSLKDLAPGSIMPTATVLTIPMQVQREICEGTVEERTDLTVCWNNEGTNFVFNNVVCETYQDECPREYYEDNEEVPEDFHEYRDLDDTDDGTE